MEIKIEELRNLSDLEFEALLDVIGLNNLKEMLQIVSKTLPVNSKYYNGKGKKGIFWRGFRDNCMPDNKIRQFYTEEVHKNKSNLECGLFIDFLNKEFGSDSDFINKGIYKEKSDVYALFSKLLNLEYDQNYVENLDKLTKTIDTQKSKYEETTKNLTKKVEELSEKLDRQKKDYEIQIKELNDKIEASNNKLNNYKQNILNKVLDEAKEIDVNLLNNVFLRNPNEVKEYLSKRLQNNIVLFKNDQIDDLKKELTLEYIILNLLGE